MRLVFSRKLLLFMALACFSVTGCGTTGTSNTPRTATEMLLLSNAVDEAVGQIDLSYIAGKEVYFDTQYLEGVVDKGYVIGTLRQHLLASGVHLIEAKDKANYILEVRSGGIGTDSSSVLVGVPQMTIPQVMPIPGIPSSIPEIPLAKRGKQTGLAKLAMFVFHRESGQIVWQSGIQQFSSTAKDAWVFGMGPFRSGTIQRGTALAGNVLPLTDFQWEEAETSSRVKFTEAFAWSDPGKPGRNGKGKSAIETVAVTKTPPAGGVIPASATLPAAAVPPAATPAPAVPAPAVPAAGAPATTPGAPQLLPASIPAAPALILPTVGVFRGPGN